MRAVAGAEPAAEVAGFANGDAAEMCAYAYLWQRGGRGLACWVFLIMWEDGRDRKGGKGGWKGEQAHPAL